MKAIREAEEVETELGIVCREVRKRLESIGGIMRHVCRDPNAAAHIMAHSKTRWDEAEVWFDRPPIFLVDQLSLDNVTTSIDQ
ncbi:unnamed protein product [Linum tenue]|uniref:Uncharacterized protein n=1 Tax=Linum tenue TaxID=586396 RepID=A0AAV0Q403_9ROSI|nr:unnamed protein product [Linum tenue]